MKPNIYAIADFADCPLSPEECEYFVYGFAAHAPDGYNLDVDLGLPNPWCAPWMWTSEVTWYRPEEKAFDMGAIFADDIFDDLEAAIEESPMVENEDA